MIHDRSISAADIVQHFDPSADPLPHRRRGKGQGVPFPTVIEPAEKGVNLGPKAADTAVDPPPCL